VVYGNRSQKVISAFCAVMLLRFVLVGGLAATAAFELAKMINRLADGGFDLPLCSHGNRLSPRGGAGQGPFQVRLRPWSPLPSRKVCVRQHLYPQGSRSAEHDV